MFLFLLLAPVGEVEVQFESWSIWMDYVASLGNLVRLRFVLEVWLHLCCPVSSTYYHTSKHVQRTLDDVLIIWVNVCIVRGRARRRQSHRKLPLSSEVCLSGGFHWPSSRRIGAYFRSAVVTAVMNFLVGSNFAKTKKRALKKEKSG
jgi:hypothetical protein